MTLPSWPRQDSARASLSSERPWAVAGMSLLLLAVLLASWAAFGWSHVAQFNGAVERLFNTSAYADDDLAVGAPELSLAGVLAAASVLAVLTGALGWAVLDGWRRVRTATVILAVVLVAFSVKVLLLNFIAGIEVPDTGISDQLYWRSVRQLNELTAWRLASWFQAFTVATGVASIVVAIAACYLLRKSAPVHHTHSLR
jgi:hypothetical protein